MTDRLKDNRLSDDDLLKVSGGVNYSDEADWGNADCTGGVDVADAVLIARFAAEDAEPKIS